MRARTGLARRGLGEEGGMNDLGKSPQYRLIAAKPAQPADGRKHRSQKSQTLIVNAMLELVAKGNLEPSADQIADIAKVGRRSVFRHFKDMDTLYREMTNSIATTMGSIVLQPFQAADWTGRVLELVDRRAVGFEKMKPFLLAGQVHRHRSPYLKASHAQFVQTPVSERDCPQCRPRRGIRHAAQLRNLEPVARRPGSQHRQIETCA